MCGRYAAATEAAELVRIFDVESPPSDAPPPNFNVAPGQQVLVVDQPPASPRELVTMKWGLVPSWAKDPKIGYRMINARLETAAAKPSFRRAWKSRRVLLPADGYYEWQAAGPESVTTGTRAARKQPFFIFRGDGQVMAMAGLHEVWRDPKLPKDAPALRTVTILTAAAAGPAAKVHDRMPVLVEPHHWDAWLDPDFADDPHALLDPQASAAGLELRPVSTVVNNVHNNGPDLLKPVTL